MGKWIGQAGRRGGAQGVTELDVRRGGLWRENPMSGNGKPKQGAFNLDDRYTTPEGRVLLTGIQALVRLPMDQHRRDRAAGIRTGTYISGYQGSPLGELDKQLRLASAQLREHDIVFQAGINEDVAATAIYGSQLLEQFPHARFDPVVGIWYGKAPGVDRTGTPSATPSTSAPARTVPPWPWPGTTRLARAPPFPATAPWRCTTCTCRRCSRPTPRTAWRWGCTASP